jgi:chemotaxis protein MotB
MEEKGLVITFVSEVLFDSGKADLKKESLPSLAKVARILMENVPENNIGIEGHTDNQPIRYSKWKSNWELSAHRALSVLQYLESKGVNPKRLSASGYGEYRSVASNDTVEGRQLNRRVEIVILPKSVKKIEQKYLKEGPQEDREEELK